MANSVGRGGGYAVSAAQSRFWIINQMLEGASAAAYNLPVALRLSGSLNFDALRKAFEALVMRHESLRTTFADVNGEPRQFVRDDMPGTLAYLDLSEHANAEQLARDIAVKEATALFDLERGPIVRARLLRLAETDHILLFNTHHIACDEWSMGVLMREIATLYDGLANGNGVSLPPLRIQYKDYAAWRNRLLEQEDVRKHRDYWHRKLAGPRPILDLPADFRRPPRKSYSAGTVAITMDPAVLDLFEQSPHVRGITLFVALVAFLKILLFRYTAQEDLIVGCPVADRDHPDLEDQVGVYVNTLALRDRLEHSHTFVDVLSNVKRTVTEALEHQAYPFDKLVSELSLERDISRSPLFDVSVTLNAPDRQSAGSQLSNLAISPFDQAFAMAKVDLSLDFTKTPSSLHLTLIYSSDLYTEERVRRFAKHFQNVAAACLRHPVQPIGRLDFLTAAERTQLVNDFTATTAHYDRDRTIIGLFEEQVSKTPDKVALAFGQQSITYRDLDRRANKLARYLQSRGVGTEVMVGSFADRSLDAIVGLLGTWKAGGVYVPLEPALPLERLALILDSCALPMILTNSILEDRLPAFSGVVVCLDTQWDEIAQEPEERLPAGADPGNAAYVIYTSGSTGIPKGVVIEHRGLSNLVEVQRRLFGVQPGDRVLQFASLNFDASIFEISMALLAGATLYLGSRDTLLPGEALSRFISDEHINLVTLPPSALTILEPAEFPALRTILVAGEACPPALPTAWSFRRRFFNLYGPTEATVWATQVLYGPAPDAASIGKPIANVQIYILDAACELVPLGIPGEVFIGGVGLARGYLNKPHLTADKFVPNPFSAEAGSRLYRTGDVGRFLPDGSIEFIGRIDNQVKLRGYRIELGEIEAVIQQHPSVLQTVALLREDMPGSKRIVAYVQPAGESIDTQELRSYLQQKLPEYMVPALILKIAEFPVGPNGKVNRRALADLDVGSAVSGREFTAPRSDLEFILARLFAQALRAERVGVTDNFFELGGDSLIATQVVSRVRELFAVELPLLGIFQNSTVAQLAELLQTYPLNRERIEKTARALEKLSSMSEEQKQELRTKRVKGGG